MKTAGIISVFIMMYFGVNTVLHPILAQQVSEVWVADQGDETYKNPILHADYSDPDVMRVGDDYFMTASSFDAVPGLPILHSKDLVNWTLVGHALRRQPPFEHFEKTQHGNGVWAPSIRYHDGEYYIFWGDPDFGIYRVKTSDPFGEWEAPVLLEPAKGIIDVCPMWDEDGEAYLVYAYAGSRAGIKSVLAIKRMDAAATRTLDEGVIVYDGHELDPTIEGPKFYKRDGYYYIFAPGGGVATGWQTVLRSTQLYGPYERRMVLHQGATAINGPHQGGWVDTQTGEDWFIHFQDKGVYGRVTHLQPMVWKDGWPVIGTDRENKGYGEPVLTHRKPNVGQPHPIATPAESDEFNGLRMGLQWQWQANPKATWSFLYPDKGVLRLYAQQVPNGARNLYETPNVLMQKFPAPAFVATAKIEFTPHPDKLLGEKAGLVIMGRSYAALAFRKDADGIALVQTTANGAHQGKPEEEAVITKLESGACYLRVVVAEGGQCRFFYSMDGRDYREAGEPFQAVEGHWIGAKVGLFCTRTETINDAGWMDVDWFRVTPLAQ
ncbi:Beta-xylosidase [Parapedobacter luteus]|uniref:Beta-xylosidase n=2 Tax=Parapedobacter luteus TaxID=623280 RepID=A0A1T5CG38_9SPHI|nr:Beta-xylosidase [Parapedobacter luteus]